MGRPKQTESMNQINIKVTDTDLNFINAKAKKYGLSRSAMIKLFALNSDFTIDMQEQLRKPLS